jgi:hypothetical protein
LVGERGHDLPIELRTTVLAQHISTTMLLLACVLPKQAVSSIQQLVAWLKMRVPPMLQGVKTKDRARFPFRIRRPHRRFLSFSSVHPVAPEGYESYLKGRFALGQGNRVGVEQAFIILRMPLTRTRHLWHLT